MRLRKVRSLGHHALHLSAIVIDGDVVDVRWWPLDLGESEAEAVEDLRDRELIVDVGDDLERASAIQGMTCVWTYPIEGQSYVEGSHAGTVEECSREAASHVEATCTASGLTDELVSGSAIFMSDRGRLYRPLPTTCTAAS